MLNAMTTFPRYHLLFTMACLLANGMSKLFRFWAGKRSRLSLTTNYLFFFPAIFLGPYFIYFFVKSFRLRV
jgi:hypothetical protein